MDDQQQYADAMRAFDAGIRYPVPVENRLRDKAGNENKER